jgi:hypothetical protein
MILLRHAMLYNYIAVLLNKEINETETFRKVTDRNYNVHASYVSRKIMRQYFKAYITERERKRDN